MVLQRPALLVSLTVADNLRMARRAGPSLGSAQIEAALSRVGLGADVMDRPASELSEGMQRRVAIARAVLNDPSVTIYDEPTAGLDAANARRIALLIRETNESLCAASVVVTHDPRCASLNAGDAVWLLDPRERHLVRQPLVGITEDEREAEIEWMMGECDRQPAQPEKKAPRRTISRFPGLFGRFLEMTAGPVPLVAVSTALVGFILMAESKRFSGLPGPLASLGAQHLPGVVAVALVLEIVPPLAGLLLAGKIGSAIAAEVGGMASQDQVLALRLMGRTPAESMYLPITSAAVAAIALLILVGWGASRASPTRPPRSATAACRPPTHGSSGNPWNRVCRTSTRRTFA